MNKYDSLIFDLDGTLWDAASATAEGWNAGLKIAGFDELSVSVAAIRKVSGMPIEQCIQVLFPSLRPSESPELLQVLMSHEREWIISRGGRLFDGVSSGIERLAEHYKLFLVSNCQDWYLDAFWSHSGLGEFFSGSDCYGRSRRSKGVMIERVVKRFGAGRSLYIGDTEGDRIAANEAGIDFGWAAYGFGKAENSPASFTSFGSLIDWLGMEGNAIG